LIKEEGRKFVDEGRKFWKEHFLDPQQSLVETVSWREFAQVLAFVLQLPIHQFDSLKALLAVTPENELLEDQVVTLERFSHILTWFGPFFIPEYCGKILSEVNELQNSLWFHGYISKDVSEKRLFHRNPGTWLLRLSTTNPSYPFTISKVMQDKTFQHKRVKQLEDGSGFNVPVKGHNKTFTSITELVQCSALGLKTPCPHDVLDVNPYLDGEEEEEDVEDG